MASLERLKEIAPIALGADVLDEFAHEAIQHFPALVELLEQCTTRGLLRPPQCKLCRKELTGLTNHRIDCPVQKVLDV